MPTNQTLRAGSKKKKKKIKPALAERHKWTTFYKFLENDSHYPKIVNNLSFVEY